MDNHKLSIGVGSFRNPDESLSSLALLFREEEFQSLFERLLLLLTLFALFSTSLVDKTPLGVKRPPTPLFRG